MAGIIKWLKPIDYASGKTFGKAEKFVATYSETLDRRGCQYRAKNRSLVSNPLTSDELSARSAFAAASQKLKTIKADQTLYDKWHAAYTAAKAAGTVSQKTLNGYIFAQIVYGNISSTNEPVA